MSYTLKEQTFNRKRTKLSSLQNITKYFTSYAKQAPSVDRNSAPESVNFMKCYFPGCRIVCPLARGIFVVRFLHGFFNRARQI